MRDVTTPTHAAYQAVQHAPYIGRAFPRAARKGKLPGLRTTKPVLQFMGRPTGNEKESQLVRTCATAHPFRDIRADRVSGTNPLNPARPEIQRVPGAHRGANLIREL